MVRNGETPLRSHPPACRLGAEGEEMTNVWLALIALLVMTSSCRAAFFDGNKLHEGCKVSGDFVLGFVAGSVDTSETGQLAVAGLFADGPMTDEGFRKGFLTSSALVRGFCAPEKASLNQLVDVYCQFLANNPAQRHLQATLLLNKALSSAWPCQR